MYPKGKISATQALCASLNAASESILCLSDKLVSDVRQLFSKMATIPLRLVASGTKPDSRYHDLKILKQIEKLNYIRVQPLPQGHFATVPGGPWCRDAGPNQTPIQPALFFESLRRTNVYTATSRAERLAVAEPVGDSLVAGEYLNESGPFEYKASTSFSVLE